MKRRALAASKIALGLSLGLVIAELAFYVRDDGAFPHVNFYVPDAQLGVRLRPNAHMRIAFGGNPPSEIFTNARGFRGADWLEPTVNDVLVVGDSQVFGLGVSASQTFSAQLEVLLGGTHVLNAGVPTYGPAEYTALVERLVRERKPEAVVYVLNMSNDLFELQHRNVDRHSVWDGWAVRKETAPASVVELPFRSWLMSQSHLVYALRQWLHAPAGNDAGFSSEGSWREIAGAARSIVPASSNAGELTERVAARSELEQQLYLANWQLMQRFVERLDNRDPGYAAVAKKLSGYSGDPHDIVERTHGEEARPINATAHHLLRAALIADQNTTALRQFATQNHDAALSAAIESRAAMRAKAAHDGALAPDSSPLGDVLERTQRACDASGARLLVVALPLDVQVSEAEWQKYGQAPIDLGPTHVLIEDVVVHARAAGALALDATPALAAAEPGAFLNHDLHMSAKGHAALARAIADALRTADTTRAPLPAERSLPPLRDELAAIPALPMPDLAAIACELRRVREWIDIDCGREQFDDFIESALSGIELVSGGRGDAVIGGGREWAARATFPLLEGDRVELRLFWEGRARVLRVQRPPGETLSISLSAPTQVTPLHGARPASILAEGGPSGQDRTCLDRKNSGACLLGLGRWKCGPEEMQFGVLRRCVPRCSPTQPCEHGRCALFQGERGCIEP